ncbi:MAG: tetratricopeptide repeat protein [Thermodesulfobacteriota bacterium]
MSSDSFSEEFRIVVSDKKMNKLGIGGTAQSTARSVYFFAQREKGGEIFIQPLGGNFCPAGDRRAIPLLDLIENYHPEPLFYYNRVKPVMDGVQADIEKGEKNLEAGRHELAEKCFKRALEVDADNVRGIFGLGTAYLEAGKTEEAEELLGRIMNLEMAFAPEHAHLFNQFGIRMRKAGMLRQALDYYGKAAALNERDEHLHFNICRIHYEMDDLDASFDCLAKALDLNGDFREGVLMRDHLLRRKPGLASRGGDKAEASDGREESGPIRVD